MTAHLRYLRYVLRHKWFVLRAGLLLRPPFTDSGESSPFAWLPWLVRLLVHDLSKFRPSEWRAYVETFYGQPASRARAHAAFQVAWLTHIHRNPHHWQHWLLQQDDGRHLVLLMPVAVVDEMVCDWVVSGTKINSPGVTMRELVAATITWYEANASVMKLRTPVRLRVEARLVELAERTGIVGRFIQTNLQTVTVPRGRVNV